MGERGVITTALSAVVEASPRRVWRAIADPRERVGWDPSTLALLDAAEGPLRAGGAVRWRFRIGRVPVLLRDCPLEVVPGEKLRSEVSLGAFRFDQTWSLHAEDEGARTRLGLSLAAANTIPLLGHVVDRFDVRRMAAEYVDGCLRAVQRWCEAEGERPGRAGRPPTRCAAPPGPSVRGPGTSPG